MPELILPDSSIFIRAFRRRIPYEELLAPFGDITVHISSVVLHELYIGARDAPVRRFVDEVRSRHEMIDRIVTPTAEDWCDCGLWLAELRRPAVGRLTNDCLIAAAARNFSMVVVTENRADFQLLATARPFRFAVVAANG